MKNLSNDAVAALARAIGIDAQEITRRKAFLEFGETEEQRAFLERSGCLTYQDYLFGKPMPLHEFEELAMRVSTAGETIFTEDTK